MVRAAHRIKAPSTFRQAGRALAEFLGGASRLLRSDESHTTASGYDSGVRRAAWQSSRQWPGIIRIMTNIIAVQPPAVIKNLALTTPEATSTTATTSIGMQHKKHQHTKPLVTAAGQTMVTFCR